jgi:hypothetical protein
VSFFSSDVQILVNKYRNKGIEIDGIHFSSRAEAKWYKIFKEQRARGEIKDFKMQVPFELVPAQREARTVFDKKGNPRTVERVVEHAVKYVADFVVDEIDGMQTVYDVKGFPTPVWGIKRKLMRYVHGIAVQEVK